MLSYEKCLQLKEAGFPQDSLLGHQIDNTLNQYIIVSYGSWNNADKRDFIACPSLEEIVQNLLNAEYISGVKILVDKVSIIDQNHNTLYKIKDPNALFSDFECMEEKIEDDNINNAIAKLWLKCKKYKLC